MLDPLGEERYDLDGPVLVELVSPAGDRVGVAVTRVEVASGVVVVWCAITVEEFARALAGGCFHLDGESLPARWDPAVPVALTLRLDDAVAEAFDDGDSLVTALFGEAATVLRRADAWYALEATQQLAVPGLPDASAAHGLRTRWADDPP